MYKHFLRIEKYNLEDFFTCDITGEVFFKCCFKNCYMYGKKLTLIFFILRKLFFHISISFLTLPKISKKKMSFNVLWSLTYARSLLCAFFTYAWFFRGSGQTYRKTNINSYGFMRCTGKHLSLRVAKLFQDFNPFCSDSKNAFPCPSPIVQIPGKYSFALYARVYVGEADSCDGRQ